MLQFFMQSDAFFFFQAYIWYFMHSQILKIEGAAPPPPPPSNPPPPPDRQIVPLSFYF